MRNQEFFAKYAKKMLAMGIVFLSAVNLAACSGSKDSASGSESSDVKTSASSSSSSSSEVKSSTSDEISPFIPNKYGISVKVIENYLKSLGYKDLGKNADNLYAEDGSAALGYMTSDYTNDPQYGFSYQFSETGINENGDTVIFSLSQFSTNETVDSIGVNNSEVGDWVVTETVLQQSFTESVNQQPFADELLTDMGQLNLAPCP